MRLLIGFLAAGLAAQTVVINPPGGGGGGAVSSVFTRTGAVTAGSGDYTAAQVTNAVDQTGSYSNPGWITALAGAKITGVVAGNEVPLTFTGPLSRTVNTVACVVATGSVAGCLAAADWTTFNGKQSALGFTPLNPANNLSEVTAATARTNLGLAAVAASGSATDLGSGTLGAARLPNAGVHTGDVSGTFPATLVKQIHETLTSVNFAASPYTVVAADSYIYCDATGGAVVINLPATSGSGRELSVKKIDATANACTLTRAGSDVIDGATTAALSTQYVAAKVADRATGFWDRTHVNQLVGDVTGASTANTVKSLNGTLLSGLGTGLLKNTTGTGVPSIAVAADVPVIPLATGVSGTLPGGSLPATAVQTNQTNTYTAGTQDLSLAAHTISAKVDTFANIPATCTVGEQFFANNATAGVNKYYCTSTNTWTQAGINATTLTTGTLPTAATAALTGDVTKSAGSNATTVAKIGGNIVTLGGAFTTSGAFSTTFTTTGTTNVTLPTTGTVLATGTAPMWTSGGFLGIGPLTFSPITTVEIYDATATTGVTALTLLNGAGQGSLPSLRFGITNSDVALRQSTLGQLDVVTVNASAFANMRLNNLTMHHLVTTGGATLTSGFGTSPSLAGTDSAGRITVGTGGIATTGVITFGAAFSTAPACVANNETTVALVQATATTTTLTLTAAAAFVAGALLTWHCTGY